ncbi:MAG: class I SAM-dependent methyltransferase [Pseudomonadota bacterium]
MLRRLNAIRQNLRRRFLFTYIKDGQHGAEIGVWQGDFSKMVLSTRKLDTYYLIDPYAFMPEFPNRMYGGTVAKSQADMDAIFEGTKAKLAPLPGKQVWLRDLSEQAADQIQDGVLDFIYLDGNHYFEWVYKDLQLYIPKIRVGGHMILDDWLWRDDEGKTPVKLAAEKFARDMPGCMDLVEVKGGQAVYKVISNTQSP